MLIQSSVKTFVTTYIHATTYIHVNLIHADAGDMLENSDM